MAEKIEDQERRTLAQAEVTEALAGDSLEKEFLRLESGYGDADVEDRLLALKREMGLIAAPAAKEPKALGAGRGEDEEEDHGDDVPEVRPRENDAPVADAVLLEEFDRLEWESSKE